MFKQLTDNVSSSLIALVASTAVTFGLLGFINLSNSESAAIMPAVTPILALASILTGVALIGHLASWWLSTRLTGLLLILCGGYALYHAEAQMSLLLPPVTLAVGAVFAVASPSNWSLKLTRSMGGALLTLTLLLFASLWTRGYTTMWATNPVAVTAAMVIMLLVSLGLLFLPQAKEQKNGFNLIGIIVATGTVIATVSIWISLSNQHIDNVKHRAELNLQKASEEIRDHLRIQNQALLRLVERWNSINDGSLAPLVAIDMSSYLADFDLIEAMAVYSPSSSAPLVSEANQESELAVLKIPSIEDWRKQQFDQQSAVVVEKRLSTQEPRFILVFPIKNPAVEPRQLAVVFNLSYLLNVSKIDYLDYFDTYLKLNSDYYLPINSQHFKTISEQALKELHFFQVSTALPVFGNEPMTFHAVLNKPSIFWRNATTNQAVLLVGLLLAMLFLATFEVNRRLTKERRKLFNIAQYDSVTGLIRRDGLEQRIDRYLRDESTATCCVLFIDLDGFKSINDNLGLSVGNTLLRHVSTRLLRQQTENIEVARFSSDEFIMFASHATIDQAKALAERVLYSIREKFDFQDVELFLTASIGISLSSNEHAEDAELLIQNADVAMSKAKERGGNTYQIFTQSMGIQYEHELRLRNKLQKAIEKEAFEVYFQPYVAANSGKIIGAEALVRWPQTDGSFIPPTEFIAIAEQTGQIVPLSHLILRQALKQLGQLRVPEHFVLSINLSVKQFQRESIIPTISELAAENHIPLHQLQFELTESVMVDDAQKVITELAELRTIGCHVAIDDFGTGFSSLAYLSKLPVDVLKIDREFTRSIYSDPASQTICKAIIKMAHGLNKMIIVEGIETQEQSDFFTREGCMGLQGYLFYKPMPFKEFRKLL